MHQRGNIQLPDAFGGSRTSVLKFPIIIAQTLLSVGNNVYTAVITKSAVMSPPSKVIIETKYRLIVRDQNLDLPRCKPATLAN